jgi:hypothetical protein
MLKAYLIHISIGHQHGIFKEKERRGNLGTRSPDPLLKRLAAPCIPALPMLGRSKTASEMS